MPRSTNPSKGFTNRRSSATSPRVTIRVVVEQLIQTQGITALIKAKELLLFLTHLQEV